MLGPHSTAGGDALKGAAAWEEPRLKRAPGRGCALWRGVHAGAGRTLEQSVPEGLYPMERDLAGAVLRELQSVGRTHIGKVGAGLSPMERGICEEKGAAETSVMS